MEMDESINVFGEKLEACGENPKAKFFHASKCNTCKEDVGSR